MRSYSRGLMISQVEVGGRSRAPAKAASLSLVHPHILLEAEALAIGKEKRLGEQERSAGEHRGAAGAGHLLLDQVHDLGIFDEAFAHGLEDVVHHDGGGLALGDGIAGGVEFVFGEVVCVFGGVEGDLVGGLVVPLFEVGVLILKGMGELVGEDRLLLFDAYPVEHVDGFGFGVVVGFDLLVEQGEEKGLEGEVAVEEAEFFEDDFAFLETLGALVLVEFLFEVAFDGGSGGELALDGGFDGQAGLLRGELDEFVYQGEELLGLVGGDVGFFFGGGLLGWGGDGEGKT